MLQAASNLYPFDKCTVKFYTGTNNNDDDEEEKEDRMTRMMTTITIGTTLYRVQSWIQ